MHLKFWKMNVFEKKKIYQVTDILKDVHKIAIVSHFNPDGDAVGSSLALYHYFKNAGYEVTSILPNPFPGFLAWMPLSNEIIVAEKAKKKAREALKSADLIFVVDMNAAHRCGNVLEDALAKSPAHKILIDHHLNPTDFADEVHSHPEASSSCEIVYELLRSEGVKELRSDIATCIYTGLMTDTGNFSYNSTRAELYDIIASLLREGVKKDEIYNAVFNQYSTDRVRLTGYALYRKMRIYPEYHLALITLSADELERYHYQIGDTEGLVNMPLQIADVYYSVYMREERPKPGTPKPRIRISFRSQGDRPVNSWAAEVFHGGGHANASGGELFGTIDQAVALFERSYKKYLKI